MYAVHDCIHYSVYYVWYTCNVWVYISIYIIYTYCVTWPFVQFYSLCVACFSIGRPQFNLTQCLLSWKACPYFPDQLTTIGIHVMPTGNMVYITQALSVLWHEKLGSLHSTERIPYQLIKLHDHNTMYDNTILSATCLLKTEPLNHCRLCRASNLRSALPH